MRQFRDILKIRLAICIAYAMMIQGCCSCPSMTVSPAPTSAVITDIELLPQQTEMWCWAASGEMLMKRLGKDVSQCDQADAEFGLQNCCGSTRPPTCVNGGWPEFDKWGFCFQEVAGPVTWEQLADQIGNKHLPIAFSWHWNAGGGHMMVAYGYRTDGATGQRYVSILDPWPVPSETEAGGDRREISWEEFLGGAQWDHTHWNDFYAVRKK